MGSFRYSLPGAGKICLSQSQFVFRRSLPKSHKFGEVKVQRMDKSRSTRRSSDEDLMEDAEAAGDVETARKLFLELERLMENSTEIKFQWDMSIDIKVQLYLIDSIK